jgi:RES domain-containing protein
MAAFEGLGRLGDRLGPGYRDLLQGTAGMAALLAGPKVASRTTKPPGVKFEGTVFRYTRPEYESTTWDAHEYNVNSNHRYTPPGQGGVYAGSSSETALAEMSHYGPTDGLKLVSKEIKVDKLLDLSNPIVREKLGISLEDITSNSYETTHRIGEFARTNRVVPDANVWY